MNSTASPTPEVLREIERALTTDTMTIGRVYRLLKEHGTAYDRVAEEMGWEVTSSVYSYRYFIDAMKGLYVPGGKVIARQTTSQTKSFLARNRDEFLSSTIEYLEHLIDQFSELARDPTERSKQDLTGVDDVESVFNSAGIYATSCRSFIERPVKSADGMSASQYYVKVGSTQNIAKRIKQLKTAMPEEPIVLLVVTNDVSRNKESYSFHEGKFHNHLRVIGHVKDERAGGGSEWFVTNSQTLKSIANLVGLKIAYELDIKNLGELAASEV